MTGNEQRARAWLETHTTPGAIDMTASLAALLDEVRAEEREACAHLFTPSATYDGSEVIGRITARGDRRGNPMATIDPNGPTVLGTAEDPLNEYPLGAPVSLGSGVLKEYRQRTGVVVDTKIGDWGPEVQVSIEGLPVAWFGAEHVYALPRSSEAISPHALDGGGPRAGCECSWCDEQRYSRAERGSDKAKDWTTRGRCASLLRSTGWIDSDPGFEERVEALYDVLEGRGVRRESHPPPSPTTRMAVAFLLTRIGSWTNTRWDQHLRYEIGDAAADAAIEWIERTFQVKDFAARPASEPWVQEVAEKKCAERGCTRQAQYCDGCSDYCRYHYDEISNTSGT